MPEDPHLPPPPLHDGCSQSSSFVDRFIESVRQPAATRSRRPRPTSPEIVAFIIETVANAPHQPLEFLRREIRARHGVSISRNTVAKIIENHGMQGGPQRDYLEWIEREWMDGKREPAASEWTKLERFNPALRERHEESTRPGERVCQAHFPIARLAGSGWVHAHIAIDTFSGYVTGRLYAGATTREAIGLLHDHVLPWYARRRTPVKTVLTTRDSIYGRMESHPFPAYLATCGIRHHRRSALHANGFVEQFSRILIRDFRLPLNVRLGGSAYSGSAAAGMASLADDFVKWLHTYNCKRPSPGYRNDGATPWSRLRLRAGKNVRLQKTAGMPAFEATGSPSPAAG
ncbi:integrase family protein [Opitutaceae bacterium TAV1]|nr:integrase family protein [Opitutaceae bacterium TAV1]